MNQDEIIESAKETALSMIEIYNDYKDDKESINVNCEDDKYISVYYGNILDIQPSGKYYMPWCTNQTEEDIDQDSMLWSVDSGFAVVSSNHLL